MWPVVEAASFPVARAYCLVVGLYTTPSHSGIPMKELLLTCKGVGARGQVGECLTFSRKVEGSMLCRVKKEKGKRKKKS